MTLYQIAQIVNRVGGYDPHLLKGCPRIEAGPMPPRAGQREHEQRQADAAAGRRPVPALAAGSRAFSIDRRWHFDRPPDEDNGPERLRTRLYHYCGTAATATIGLTAES